jgi:hypothetical protein
MMLQMLKRRIIPVAVELESLRWMIVMDAVLIPGYGFCKMAALGLTPTQCLLGLGVIMALVLQCIVLLALIELLKRKVA